MTESAPAANTNSHESTGGNASSSNSATGSSDPVVAAPSYKGTKHKIDFDGHEVELDYDTLVNDFKKHAKDAYELRQQLNPAMEFIDSLKKGELAQLKKLGITDDVLREFSEKQLLEYIEYQNMDPRERQLKEREAKIDAMERKYKEEQEVQERTRYEAEMSRAHQQVQSDLVAAAKELVGDAKITPRYLRRVAEKMYAALENNQQFDARSLAKSEWDGLGKDYQEYQSLMLKKDPKAFISSLPPEIIKAIREHELSASRPLKRPEMVTDQGYEPEKKGLGLDESFAALDRHYNRKRKQRMNQ